MTTPPPIKISDEMIEAATQAIHDMDCAWANCSDNLTTKGRYGRWAKAAAKAVAPLIAAQVLRERSPLFAWITDGFTMHSGSNSNWKIECDSLSAADWETLARVVAERVEFGSVEGVPRGGLPLAAALEQFASPGGPLLIVDDVWTTGRSMEAHRAGRDAVGVVAFARAPVSAPWVKAMFTADPGGVWRYSEADALATGSPLQEQCGHSWTKDAP